MKMNSINEDKSKTILLIHPMLSSSEAMKLFIADYLGDDYHYLIPDLANHATALDQTYKSAKIEAKEIYNYLKEHNITDIQLGFGASLGGVVLFELLKYEDINFKHMFFEGTSFNEHATLVNYITKKIFLSKHKKAVANPSLSVQKMSKIYGETSGEVMAKAFISMNEESIKNIVYDCAFVDLPELSKEKQELCVFAFGEKDSDLKPAKKVQPIKYPHSTLKIWKGYDHCTRMTQDTEEYSKILKQYL